MLNPTSFYQNFFASRIAGPIPLLGISFDQFALKLSNALFLWMYNQPQNISLIGQTIGTAGTGVISPLTSKLILIYNPLPLQSRNFTGEFRNISTKCIIDSSPGIGFKFIFTNNVGDCTG